MPSPVVFFQIATTDPEKSRQFFSQLFDWDFAESGPPTPITIDPKGPADFDPKGSFLQLPPGAPPFVSIFVRVDDIRATLAKAQSLDAPTIVPVTRLPSGTDIAIIRTPEGHSIGIVQA